MNIRYNIVVVKAEDNLSCHYNFVCYTLHLVLNSTVLNIVNVDFKQGRTNFNIVACLVVHATKMTGSILDDWIY
jgi:hypothetical protein